MAKDLEIVGPFDIPFQRQLIGSAKHIGRPEVREFWTKPDAAAVASKQGCYVFALRASRGFRPLYIGKATKGMAKECFTHHKLAHFNQVLFQAPKGTPVMFFAVLPGTKCKVSAKTIDQIETFFIQTAVNHRPDILNVQKTNIPNWTVKGVVRGGAGKPPKNAVQFRKMMGIGR